LSPANFKTIKCGAPSTSRLDPGFNHSVMSSSTSFYASTHGSEDVTEQRQSFKKDDFAKPVGLGSTSRSRSQAAPRQRKVSKAIQVGGEKTRPTSVLEVVDKSCIRGMPINTPRTKLKNHCLEAADKLGTLPSALFTAHRRKIARMQYGQDKKQRESNHNNNKTISIPGNKINQSTENINKKRKTPPGGINECTPQVKRQKIRPRTDGPITRTQQRGFMKMRDKLLEEGVISEEIRSCLKKEEAEQILRGGRKR